MKCPHHFTIGSQVKTLQILTKLLIMGENIALIKCIGGNGKYDYTGLRSSLLNICRFSSHFFVHILKIMLLANRRKSTQIALAKWNFILNTEYPHSYKIKKNSDSICLWGGAYMPISHFHLHFAKKFSH